MSLRISIRPSRRELQIIALVCLILSILIPVVFYDKNPFGDFHSFFKSFLITSTYTLTLWIVNSTICKHTWIKFPIPQFATKNVITQVVIVPIATFLAVLILVYIDSIILNQPYQEIFIPNLLISMVITLILTTLYNSVYLFKDLESSIAEKEKLEKANVQSQLDILKNQIKPHFLFNSLNTLATLIPEDTDQSVKYVESLAMVYRYILEIRDQKIIPIHEELKCISAYLFMLQIRFGNNLKVRINEGDLNHHHHIVPLSIQLLIENAMKHNIVSNKRPLHIDIYKGESNRLFISNNLQKKDDQEPSTGIGLKNINQRYEIITDESIDIIVTENKFTVSIPLITVK